METYNSLERGNKSLLVFKVINMKRATDRLFFRRSPRTEAIYSDIRSDKTKKHELTSLLLIMVAKKNDVVTGQCEK